MPVLETQSHALHIGGQHAIIRTRHPQNIHNLLIRHHLPKGNLLYNPQKSIRGAIGHGIITPGQNPDRVAFTNDTPGQHHSQKPPLILQRLDRFYAQRPDILAHFTVIRQPNCSRIPNLQHRPRWQIIQRQPGRQRHSLANHPAAI